MSSDVESAIPPHLVMDLGYAIAMFMFALVGLRFTLRNCFGIDILNFRTLPAQIAGGLASLLILFSIYRLVTDPHRIASLGRKLVGRQYLRQQAMAKRQERVELADRIAQLNEDARPLG